MCAKELSSHGVDLEEFSVSSAFFYNHFLFSLSQWLLLPQPFALVHCSLSPSSVSNPRNSIEPDLPETSQGLDSIQNKIYICPELPTSSCSALGLCTPLTCSSIATPWFLLGKLFSIGAIFFDFLIAFSLSILLFLFLALANILIIPLLVG